MKNITTAFLIMTLGMFSLRSNAQCNFFLPDVTNFNKVGYAYTNNYYTYQLIAGIGIAGAAWYRDSADLNYDFDVSFITGQWNVDGMVFVLQSCSNGLSALGGTGGNLGYYGNTGAFTHSLGVEMDGYDNGATMNDPDNSHLAVVRDGLSTPVAGPVSGIYPPLYWYNTHTLRLTWNASTHLFSVYFDGYQTSYTDDLINDVFAGNPHVYFGFTAASGDNGSQAFTVNYMHYHESHAHTNTPSIIYDSGTCPGGTLKASPGADSYLWSTGATTNSISNCSPATYTVTVTDHGGCSRNAQYTVNPIAGDPSVFGDHVWNVYVWNAGDENGESGAWTNNYSGYFTDNNLNFNSEYRWPKYSNPSIASGYQGCTVNYDNHSWSAKRRGFTPACYQINIPSHDDAAQLFVHGVKVWEHIGCCDAHTNVWTGSLNDTSTVEFRGSEGVGDSRGSIELVAASANIYVNGPLVICPGYSVQLSANAGDSYLWSTGESTQSISVNATGNYTVSITSGGCTTGSTAKAISVAAMDTPVIHDYPYTSACPGSYYNYAWIDYNTRYSSILWSTGSTYTSSSFYTGGTHSVTVSDAFGCSATSHVTIPGPMGNPSVFGDHVWNVYAWNAGGGANNGQSWTNAYSGYYVESNLSFNSQNRWYYRPSDASGYQGCSVNYDYHSWSANRRGFTPGTYQINIPGHDDDAQLFVNGVKVWEHLGCCDAHTNVWTGCLNDTSTVEYKVSEIAGGSNGIIEFIPINAITQNGPSTICPGYTLQLTASAANSYLWSTGETTQSISVNTSGNYSVEMAISGCPATASTSITVAAMDTPVINHSSPFSGVCPGSTVNAWIDNNSRYSTFLWTNGSTTASVNLAVGTHTVTVSDALGCSANSHAVVTGPPGNSSVFGDHVWNVYAWDAGDQNGSNGAWTNNYSGYYIETNLSFNTQNRWNVNYSPSSASGYLGCFVGYENHSWSAKRRGFTSGYYQINIPGHDDAAQLFVNGVKVWEHIGCCDSHTNVWSGCMNDSSTVEFRGTEGGGGSWGAIDFINTSTITLNGPATICPGYSAQLTAGTSDNYLWSTGATTQSISVNTAGNYSVEMTKNGCLATSSIAIAVAAMDTPAISSNSAFNYCPGTGATLSINSDPRYSSVSWSNGATSTTSYLGGGGNYSVIVSDALGCSATSHRSVTGPPGDPSQFGNNVWDVYAYNNGYYYSYYYSWQAQDYAGYYVDSNFNFNTENKWGSYYSSPSSAQGYQGCSVNNYSLSWSAKRQGFPCSVYQIDVASHYYAAQLFVDGIMVWSHEGCCDNHTNVWTGKLNADSKVEFRGTSAYSGSYGAINITPVPFTIAVAGNPIVCTGQYYILTSPVTGSSYSWSNGGTTNPLQTGVSGDYFVTVNDTVGCTLSSDTTSITVLPDATPVANITASSNTICNWNPVTLSSDSASGNYWSGPSGFSEFTDSISISNTGTYTLTVTNNAGCTAQSSTTITRAFIPPTPIASNNGPICQNSSLNLIAGGLAPGGQAAVFNGSNQYITVSQDIPENDFTIELWVKTTAANGGIFCARNASSSTDRQIFLSGNQLRVFVAGSSTWTAPFTINDGKWHHIALVVQTGVGQIVYVDGVSSGVGRTFDHSTLASQATFRIGSSGSSTIFNGQIDNVRIWSVARTQTDIQNNMFLITPDSTTNLIYEAALNGKVNATIGNNGITPNGISYDNTDYYTYTWSGPNAPSPSTSEIQTDSAASVNGTYSVTASIDGGCSPSANASTNAVFVAMTAPVAQITQSSNTICDSNPVTLSSDSASGNQWSTGETSQSITVSIAGDYSLTVTNSGGCYSQQYIHINKGFIPASPATSNTGPVCENSSVSLTASGLAPGVKAALFTPYYGQYIEVVQDIPESDFTIEMWVKTTNGNCGIFSVNDGYFYGTIDRQLFLSNGELWTGLYGGNLWGSGVIINDGQWHHIAYVVQSGVGQKIYVDGNLAPNTNSYDHSDLSWQSVFEIGFAYGATQDYFDGQIDNVRIWSEARTQTDVHDNMSLAMPLDTTNLVYESTLDGNENAAIGNNGYASNGMSYLAPDFYTYTWTGPGAPVASTDETQTITASASGTYTVSAKAGACESAGSSTDIVVIPLVNYYPDADSDGYGSPDATALSSCTNPGAGYVTNNTDCNDADGTVWQVAVFYTDMDSDGYDSGPVVFCYGTSVPAGYSTTTNGTDCDDADNAVNPAAYEVCNSVDDNCNGQVDEGNICDNDGDGYTVGQGDCDDNNALIYPNAVEACNSVDDNCNGQIDEGVKTTFYHDADGDGYGTSTSSVLACTAPSGYVTNSTDCNDVNGNVNPGKTEVCNNIDDNCNGQIDEGVKTTFYRDADGDGYGISTSSVLACSAPVGYVSNNTDCNDLKGNIHPGATETCNNIDDNCNGQIDENALTATINPSGIVSFCAGGNVTLTANAGSGLLYQWIKNGVNISGATKRNYTTQASGNYQVKETKNACRAISVATVVNVIASPSATITPQGNLNICLAGSVVLQANIEAGLTYQWMKGNSNILGATNSSYTATTKGNYKVVVTSAGCSKTSLGVTVTKSCRMEDENSDNETIAGALTIYPNPTTGVFVVDLNLYVNVDEKVTIQLYNSIGQLIQEEVASTAAGKLNTEIHLASEVPGGLYLVRILAGDELFTRQLIIQK